jgi:short subunit dehydrogenase-like uncharacterized protein
MRRGFLRQALEWLGPASGQGPSPRALERMGYRLDVIATASDGKRVRGTVIGDGHPGYRSTAALVAEAAVALARDRQTLTPVNGIVTPASGLGLGVLPRLERAGLRMAF